MGASRRLHVLGCSQPAHVERLCIRSHTLVITLLTPSTYAFALTLFLVATLLQRYSISADGVRSVQMRRVDLSWVAPCLLCIRVTLSYRYVLCALINWNCSIHHDSRRSIMLLEPIAYLWGVCLSGCKSEW